MALTDAGERERTRDELLTLNAQRLTVVARVAAIAERFDELHQLATTNASGEFKPTDADELTTKKTQYKAAIVAAANGI